MSRSSLGYYFSLSKNGAYYDCFNDRYTPYHSVKIKKDGSHKVFHEKIFTGTRSEIEEHIQKLVILEELER